jgi:hypothetical protein
MMVVRAFLILVATGLMACDSDESTPADTTEVLSPDASDTTEPADTSTPDTMSDTAMPDTTPDIEEDTADTSTPDTAMPDTADTTMPDTADTAMPDTADTAMPDADPPAGACDNQGDFDTLASLQSTLESKIQTCAFSCLGQGASCAATCIENETELSTACSACFGEVISCTITNCALQCIDANSAGCTTCRDTNCTPAFEACAGIEQP